MKRWPRFPASLSLWTHLVLPLRPPEAACPQGLGAVVSSDLSKETLQFFSEKKRRPMSERSLGDPEELLPSAPPPPQPSAAGSFLPCGQPPRKEEGVWKRGPSRI